MKRVEVTMTFTVPGFYTFDDVSSAVSQITSKVRETANERSGVGVTADVVSVVVDEDDEEES
jgi:hypothetical protein